MEFVNFEIAKKLKEKGFKEKCIAYYWEKINEHTASFVVEDNMPEDGLCLLDLLSNHNKSEWSPFIDAPTISQVLKWLSDKKEVDLVIEPIFFFDKNRRREYNVRVFAPSLNKPMHCGYFNTREEAALTGIEYAINKLII